MKFPQSFPEPRVEALLNRTKVRIFEVSKESVITLEMAFKAFSDVFQFEICQDLVGHNPPYLTYL